MVETPHFLDSCAVPKLKNRRIVHVSEPFVMNGAKWNTAIYSYVKLSPNISATGPVKVWNACACGWIQIIEFYRISELQPVASEFGELCPRFIWHYYVPNFYCRSRCGRFISSSAKLLYRISRPAIFPSFP